MDIRQTDSTCFQGIVQPINYDQKLILIRFKCTTPKSLPLFFFLLKLEFIFTRFIQSTPVLNLIAINCQYHRTMSIYFYRTFTNAPQGHHFLSLVN